MDFIPYNSRRTYHKSPFGAVREGEEVTFSFAAEYLLHGRKPRYNSRKRKTRNRSDELGENGRQ